VTPEKRMDCDSSKDEFGLLAIVAVIGLIASRADGDNIGPNSKDFHRVSKYVTR
jgi:hypothetical protein